jgi:hypothetical protein
MQLITFLSAAAATIATASARTAISLNKSCDKSQPYARIINRCNYPVNIWSVHKGEGCPAAEKVTLKKGEVYAENYLYARRFENGQWVEDDQGISIKISKTDVCKGNDITQLEYFMDNRLKTEQPFQLNYLDVSYVDCVKDCPTKQEGYYLQAGSATARTARKAADNSWCPQMACHDPISCAKISYILPDDVQTKTCDLQSSMDFYMCGSEAPSSDDETPETPESSAPAPASSQKVESSVVSKPSTTLTPVVSSAANYKIKAAAVTEAPEIKDDLKAPKVKTKVVYVTAYEYVNAKRHEHAHAHARRHQPFNA